MDPTQAAGPSQQQPQHATAADRRLLRQEYRQVDEEARGKTETMVNLHNSLLRNMLHKTNELHSKVEKPREGALDASLFSKLTEVGSKATERLMTQQPGRTTHEFIQALKKIYVGGHDPQNEGANNPLAFRWDEMSDNVARFFKPVPGVNCMHGGLSVKQKVRKVAQRQARRPTGVAQRPEELEQIQDTGKQETDRNVEEMLKVIEQLPSSCPLAELILNHQCFAQTVENLFALSFLVCNMRVHLSFKPEVGIMVQDVRAARPAPAAPGKRPDEQMQFVMALTVKDWEVMKGVVKPGDTKMPHRDRVAQAAPNDRGSDRQQQRQQEQEQEDNEEEEQEEEAGPSNRPARYKKKGRR